MRSNKAEAEQVVAESIAAGGKAAVHRERRRSAGGRRDGRFAVKEFGRIDILVNNAALRREKPIAEMTYAEWREIMDVTLDGAFHCVKACLPHLQASGAGAIINIGGLSAHTGAKHRAHVITAKAGLVGFTRALAHDLAADSVTVNCVSPGTDRHAREPAGEPEPQHHSTQCHADRQARRARRGRRDGALSVRPRRALHHRTDHPREWRRLSRIVMGRRASLAHAISQADVQFFFS